MSRRDGVIHMTRSQSLAIWELIKICRWQITAACRSVKLGANFIVQSGENGAIKKVKNFLIKIGAIARSLNTY